MTDDSRSAGARPNSALANRANPAVTPSVARSSDRSERYGVRGPSTLRIAAMMGSATSTLNTPPTSDNATLSTNSWRMIRPRRAPSAARMAISPRRSIPRASRRFAMCAHAAASSSEVSVVTRPKNTFSPGPNGSSPVTRMSHPALVCGCSSARRCASACISACAVCALAPGRNRPTVISVLVSRESWEPGA